ncbi:Serine carboxypeptidase [Popillia japonica]|uniref:Retinoid-inducible serine carboxypeptidase n=1 Tax=Popillia japonica TaxID=7064 RepID=A0AAW1JYQ2_POPJA
MKLLALVILTLLARSQARQGFGTEEQDWGYVTVRPGAHMFWWLYFTTATENYGERPLVVWLQGGPGASSTGYGNFAELGPLDLDLNPRDHTWTKDVNVLFVDNPVGTGFSYAESTAQLTTTNRQIAEDFVELMRGFYTEHPEFVNSPFYILSQSYGGKMAIEMGQVLDEAIKAGTIESNFIGVGLGDPWVDPVTLVLEWAPYLLAVGAVDQAGHDAVAAAALRTKELFDQGQYAQSTSQWATTEYVIMREAHNIDFYDILKPIPASGARSIHTLGQLAKPQARDEEDEKLDIIMTAVKEALGLNVTWGAQSGAVFNTLRTDFMKNVTAVTQDVLDNTDIKVAVYNGQLDLIVGTPGIVIWLDNLEWKGTAEWAVASRPAIAVNGINEGYEKIVGNLAMFWVNRAGHMVPAHNPAAMDHILRWLTNDYDGTVRRT